MKPELALRLLGGLMKWEFLRANEEFKWLNLLVEYKYDHYQGYSPGARFLINLINWLKQFPTVEKKGKSHTNLFGKGWYLLTSEKCTT